LAHDAVTIVQGGPDLTVIGQEFVGDWESDPIKLQGEYFLEFLPIVLGHSGPASFRILVRSGRDEQEVALVDGVLQRDLNRFLVDSLKTVRVDLSGFTGRTVQVVVRIESTGDRRGIIGHPRLRPVADSLGRPPDILMVCSDTLRWDTSLGSDGSRLMPALSRLQGDVVAYGDAFSVASWTMPSITTALTGLNPRFHGTGERAPSIAGGPPPGHFSFKSTEGLEFLRTYPPDLESLPEKLLEAGYSTRMVAGNPLYFLSGLARDGFEIAVRAGVSPGPRITRLAKRLLLSADPDVPLFLLVHYMDPHEWKDQYVELFGSDADPRDDPEGVREAYKKAVTKGDSALGRLLSTWARNRGDQTLVVFWSDHGEHLLENDLLGHGNSMSDLLLKVPLVIRYPPGEGPSTADADRTVSLADLTPTILDIAGITYTEGAFSGESLVRPTASTERLHFADYQLYGSELASVRQGEYKLVIDLDSDRSKLWQAQGTKAHLEVEDAHITEELMKAYQTYLSAALEARQDLELPDLVDDDEALEALKELGYVQ
jgi:arylsulfatase A-like enzyme